MEINSIRAAFDARNKAVNDVRELHDLVEGRDMSAEETAIEVRLDGEISKLDGEINGGLALVDREAKAVEARAKLEAIETFDSVAPAGYEEARAAELAAVGQLASGEIRSYEARDLTAGTSTDGAELVPTSLYNKIVEHMVEQSPILQLATIIRTAGGEQIDIPKTTSYSAAAIVAEAGTIGESDPQFGTVSLNAYKYGFIVQASSELLTDAAFNVEDFIARQGGAALGRGVDAHLVTGSGSSQPSGVDLATVGITAAATGAVTFDELIDLQHSIIAPYQGNAAFLMSDATLAAVRKLKDSNGLYLWQPATTVGAPSTLLGKAVHTDGNVADMAANGLSVVYGDFSTYYARLAGAVRIERSDDHGFANDLVSWRFLMRADGDIVDTNGLRVLKMAAS